MLDFIYIGPDKSGSSWLYELLLRSKVVQVASGKDLYYFDRYYHLGAEWYQKHLPNKTKGTEIIGEISHDYLFSPIAAHRIQRDCPSIKLLSFLRSPIERSYSQYLYMRRSGMVGDDFWAAVDKYPTIITNSLYVLHLREYFDRFDPNQILLMDFADLKRSELDFATSILDFVGSSESPTLPGVVRQASQARSKLVARLAKSSANFVRELGYPNIVGNIKHHRFTKLLYSSQPVDSKLDNFSREYLADFFSSYNDLLAAEFSFDVSDWTA